MPKDLNVILASSVGKFDANIFSPSCLAAGAVPSVSGCSDCVAISSRCLLTAGWYFCCPFNLFLDWENNLTPSTATIAGVSFCKHAMPSADAYAPAEGRPFAATQLFKLTTPIVKFVEG